jgi:hypothetical protein
MLAAAGASLLYLPPYSPDLAPGSQHRPPRSCGAARRSSRSSPSSRRGCARPEHGPRTTSGRPSAASSPPSRQPNAPAISTTANMRLSKRGLPRRRSAAPGCSSDRSRDHHPVRRGRRAPAAARGLGPGVAAGRGRGLSPVRAAALAGGGLCQITAQLGARGRPPSGARGRRGLPRRGYARRQARLSGARAYYLG